MEIKTAEEKAIILLKEIRMISGRNARDYFTPLSQVVEFSYINKLIDKFTDEFKLEGFKKQTLTFGSCSYISGTRKENNGKEIYYKISL